MIAAARCLALVAVVWVGLSFGCSDRGDKNTQPNGGGSEEVSFADIVQPIFTGSCASAGCHGGGAPSADLDLSPGQSYAALVNVPAQQRPALKRVLPNEPDSSYLYHRLTGAQGASLMPPGGGLPAGQIAEIRQWIEEGARDN